MKKFFYLLCALPLASFAQTQFVTTITPNNLTNYELVGKKIDVLPNGNYLMLGDFTENNQTYPAINIQSQYGHPLAFHYYTNGFSAFSYVIDDVNKHIYITGTNEDNTTGELYVSKIDFNGVLSWEKSFPISNSNRFVSPKVVLEGSELIILASNVPSTANGLNDDNVYFRIDLSGNLVSSKITCSNSNCSADDEFYDLAKSNTGDLVAVGWKGSNAACIQYLDNQLNTTNYFESTSNYNLRSVTKHPKGILTGGEHRSSNNNLLTLIDETTMTSLWAVNFKVNGSEIIIRDIHFTAMNEIVVVGGNQIQPN